MNHDHLLRTSYTTSASAAVSAFTTDRLPRNLRRHGRALGYSKRPLLTRPRPHSDAGSNTGHRRTRYRLGDRRLAEGVGKRA